jgi:hypothetical protein
MTFSAVGPREKILASNALGAAIEAAESPALAATARPKVVVEVTGGVAEVTTCPDGVDVEIIDHDNLEAEAEQAKIAEHGISFGGKGGVS